ncbi:MAG TPA: alpha-ketoacid dehydrogenase subunit beta [Methanomassiliicoccales archaeon]|nr:alpha-ketoacid dehydrogenase subunit beta [Methanomassiliicoccales archaeon]
MAVMNMVQAINLALREEMERDPSVVCLGEDVGVDGGVFRVTEGLFQKFGKERMIDTPLAESCIVGTAIGMAMNGLRPVAEIQFLGFIYPAYQQLVSHAARMRNRTRGRITLPMVIRAPYGAGVKALEHHSESTEAVFCHIPGLKVVVPSTPLEAKGLLASAVRDPDPVLFLEPTRSYRLLKEEVPDGEYLLPLGKARKVREGKDVTIVGWGAMMPIIQKAVESLEKEGLSPEVLDLRTLAPMDHSAIVDSVKRTGRCVVVHEAPRSFGVGAEISARVMERALLSLLAPVERVTAPDITVPLPKGEHYYYISPERVVSAVKRAMSF